MPLSSPSRSSSSPAVSRSLTSRPLLLFRSSPRRSTRAPPSLDLRRAVTGEGAGTSGRKGGFDFPCSLFIGIVLSLKQRILESSLSLPVVYLLSSASQMKRRMA